MQETPPEFTGNPPGDSESSPGPKSTVPVHSPYVSPKGKRSQPSNRMTGPS